MANTRTYWCGQSGVVRRLTDFTFPWVSVNISNTQVSLNDIKTDPTDNQKVFTVGTGNTIQVSSNAGGIWSTPGGGYLAYPTAEWHEVWPIDPLNIVAVGSLGLVAISNDGGLTFGIPNPIAFPNTGSVRAVHFLTPLIGVVGYDDKAFKTIDGGLTWIPLNSGLGLISVPFVGVITQINGIHISQGGTDIIVNANTEIWRSTDSGTTFQSVYKYYHPLGPIFVAVGRHLTWYSDNELWGIGDFNVITRSTNGGASWVTAKDAFPSYSNDPAGHFYTTKDGFYNIAENLYSTSDADTNLTPVFSDTTGFVEIPPAAVWTALPGPCYNLLACGGRPFPLLVDNDLSLLVGQVVMVDGACYTVQLAQSCQGAVTITTPITSFPDCCSCNPPNCYELRDCTAQTPVIITDTNLAQYVGQTIKVCDFQSGLVISTPQPSINNCQGGETMGYVTLITGPTSGFFYENSSGLILPYVNPASYTLVVGASICFGITAGPVYTALSSSTIPTRTIQFFLGITPITNAIPFDTNMSVNFLQYLITLNTIDPTITLTVAYFTALGLNVQMSTTAPITETSFSAILNPPYTTQSTFTEDITGSCICYTVFDIGPGCNCQNMPFLGTISGVFPDCECCLPQPLPPEPPPYEPTIPEIDKHTYRICESQCDIDNNKNFANAMYDIFKTEAYGFESCCPRNFNQIWIAKELSDLSKINC